MATECQKLITLDYLNSFTNGLIQDDSGQIVSVNYNGKPGTYCPTYADLTGGTYIQKYVEGSSLSSDKDGINVKGTYALNQCVIQQDLEAKYTRFDSLNLSASPTEFNISGGTSTLNKQVTFSRYTKSLDAVTCSNTSTASTSQTDNNIAVEWNQNPTIGTINYPNFVIGRAPSAMTSTLSASVNFRGTDKVCVLPVTFDLTGTPCTCTDFEFTSLPVPFESGDTSVQNAIFTPSECITITSVVSSQSWLTANVDSTSREKINVMPNGVNSGGSRNSIVMVSYMAPDGCFSSATFTVYQSGGCDCEGTVVIPESAVTSGVSWAWRESGVKNVVLSVNADCIDAASPLGGITATCDNSHFIVNLLQSSSDIYLSCDVESDNETFNDIIGYITLAYKVKDNQTTYVKNEKVKLIHTQKECDCYSIELVLE